MHSSDEGIVWPDDLDPREASAYLSKRGVRAKPETLANWRSTGDGPLFRTDGRRVLYPRVELDRFVEKRLSRLVRSTSELRGSHATT